MSKAWGAILDRDLKLGIAIFIENKTKKYWSLAIIANCKYSSVDILVLVSCIIWLLITNMMHHRHINGKVTKGHFWLNPLVNKEKEPVNIFNNLFVHSIHYTTMNMGTRIIGKQKQEAVRGNEYKHPHNSIYNL